MKTCQDCSTPLANQKALRCYPCFNKARTQRERAPKQGRFCQDCNAPVANYYALRCQQCAAKARAEDKAKLPLRVCPSCNTEQRHFWHGVCSPCGQKARYKKLKGDPQFDAMRLGSSKRWAEKRRGCPELKKQRANQKRKSQYGLTPERYQEMLAEQAAKCAICEQEKALVVDHCHTHGHVRALLCAKCNLCLGYLEKNRDLYEGKLQAYLSKHTLPQS